MYVLHLQKICFSLNRLQAHEPLNINNYLQLLEATKMANVIEDMLNTQPSESQSYSQQLPLSNSLIGNESQLLNNNDV